MPPRASTSDSTSGKSPANPTDSGVPIGRRLFLGVMGVGALSVAFGNTLQRVVGSIVSPLVKQGGGGLGALIPGANRFRIYTITGSYPVIASRRYSLEVGGLVANPMRLSLSDLKSLPREELVRDFQCVTGWRVPNVEWAGVRLGHIIDLAKPTTDAKGVEFTSYDGAYTESLTIEEARRSDVLVAYEMLGGAITAEHGGPVRLYVAPMYGYKSAKWLESISLVPKPIPGFWEQNGYDVEAWIGASNGRHDAPVS